jgi:hypothetical protein
LRWPLSSLAGQRSRASCGVAQFSLVRRHMRILRVLLIVVVVMASAIGALLFHPMFQSHYIQLQHKSPEYYAELAAACDSILAEHPSGTNDTILIPVSDPSLPQVVRGLHPLRLQVSGQNVWMLLNSDSRVGIGLEWHPKVEDTNVWVMDIAAESLETVIYSVKR